MAWAKGGGDGNGEEWLHGGHMTSVELPVLTTYTQDSGLGHTLQNDPKDICFLIYHI